MAGLTRPLRLPWDLKGTTLPPTLVVLARGLALLVLLQGQFPFPVNVPILEPLQAVDGVWATLARPLAIGACVVVLCSTWVRAGAAVLGLATLFGILACVPCSSGAHTFLGLLLVTLGCSSTRTGSWPVRAQLVFLYLAAALSKSLDVDWWTGATMRGMLVERYEHAVFAAVFDAWPPAAVLVGVGVIVLEVVIGVLLWRRATLRHAVAIAVAFHLSLTLVFGHTFGPFLAVLLLSHAALLSDHLLQEGIAEDADRARAAAAVWPSPLLTGAVVIAVAGPWPVLRWATLVAIAMLLPLVLRVGRRPAVAAQPGL